MENLIVVKTLAQLEDLKAYLADKEYIAYDTETDGLQKDARVIGFSVCAEVTTAYYVVISEWIVTEEVVYAEEETVVEEEDGNYGEVLVSVPRTIKSGYLRDLETKEKAGEFLQTLVGKRLIMHNAIFDCDKTAVNFGVELMPSLHTDTMILAHLVNENRRVGLKELGVSIFGEDADVEQALVKESVLKNGGVLNKTQYELYKGDVDLLARYGAKDTILTLKLFYHLVPELYEQGLDQFFYEDESMPLLKGPTYELNTTGLRVDPEALQGLRLQLETECLEAHGFIYSEINSLVKSKYPGTSAAKTFNIGSTTQLAWLLFVELKNDFSTLTDSGRELCRYFEIKLPYSNEAKRTFLRTVQENLGKTWVPLHWVPKTAPDGTKTWWNPDTKRIVKRPRKVGEAFTYMACGKESLGKLAPKYKWVEKLLEHAKNKKILNTYVLGIQQKMQYNIIRPSFLQHGTTSGRYSSREPNFQNLPRKDKRVKSCIVSRPGMVFVGADQAQLEPRVFASTSKDPTLMACFAKGEDFYSVVGAPIYDKVGLSLYKDEPGSFAQLHPDLRDDSKVVALATPYGRTAPFQAMSLGISISEAQDLIDKYFEAYPLVEAMMLESHEQAKTEGQVFSLFGRPRRIPEALEIKKIYGNSRHSDLPAGIRTYLNLAMNHRVQSTAASIMNRAAIACYRECRKRGWKDSVRLVLQVHDELVLEGPEALAQDIAAVLKYAMEQACTLPGVPLQADPKIGRNLAELK